MNHKNIIKIKEIVVSKPQKKICKGDQHFQFFNIWITNQVVQCFKYSKELILHRDIKSVNLLLKYSEKIDLWSMGCILAQFFIGEILFKKQAQYSQIEKIYEVLGGLQENNFQEAKNYVYQNDFKLKQPYPKQLNQ